MNWSQQQSIRRFHQQRLRDENDRKKIAEWAGVDATSVAKSSVSKSANMKAALQIIEQYPDSLRVKAGKVHDLLKGLIHAAIGGADENILDFKDAKDDTIGDEGLKKIARWNRIKKLGDICVEDVYRIRMTRRHAEIDGLVGEAEKLLEIERQLMRLTKQLRKETRTLSHMGRLYI